MSCRRARRFESKRTNEPPTECRGCEVQPRLALALRGLSWFIPTSHTQHATCHGSPTAPLPDDARCIRPPFPPSSIRAAQPAIWSETWYGPGTQLRNRWSDRFFLRGDGSCQSPNCSPPIGKTIGYLDPSPLWGLVVAWFPGFPCSGCPPYFKSDHPTQNTAALTISRATDTQNHACHTALVFF